MHHRHCALRTQTWPRGMLAHVDHTRNYMPADHRVYRDRDEIGGVYLPSQLQRTLQLCTVMVNNERGCIPPPPTLTSLG
jgi:hypothetical protein